MEKCLVHGDWIVFAEARPWFKGMKPDHVKPRSG